LSGTAPLVIVDSARYTKISWTDSDWRFEKVVLARELALWQCLPVAQAMTPGRELGKNTDFEAPLTVASPDPLPSCRTLGLPQTFGRLSPVGAEAAEYPCLL
jgi:hypothetical protein